MKKFLEKERDFTESKYVFVRWWWNWIIYILRSFSDDEEEHPWGVLFAVGFPVLIGAVIAVAVAYNLGGIVLGITVPIVFIIGAPHHDGVSWTVGEAILNALSGYFIVSTVITIVNIIKLFV